MHCCFVMLCSQHASSILGEHFLKMFWKSRSSRKDVLSSMEWHWYLFSVTHFKPLKKRHTRSPGQCQVVSLIRGIYIYIYTCVCAVYNYIHIHIHTYTHSICARASLYPKTSKSQYSYARHPQLLPGFLLRAVERPQLSRGHYTGDRAPICRAL